MTLPFPSTSEPVERFGCRCFPTVAMLLFITTACAASRGGDEGAYEGAIAYPFAAPTAAIGRDVPQAGDRMIIRSTAGKEEYIVEIPEGARDYDLEIPLAHDLDASAGFEGGQPGNGAAGNPQPTDSEMVADMPRYQGHDTKDAAVLNKSLGLAPEGGPSQGPSYSLGIAKVNQLYLRSQFELALIEVNNLVAFYPNSPRLYKMKGTLYLKMQNRRLARKAWQTALALEPDDTTLRRALEILQSEINSPGPAVTP